MKEGVETLQIRFQLKFLKMYWSGVEAISEKGKSKGAISNDPIVRVKLARFRDTLL